MYFRAFVLTVTAAGLCLGDFRYDQSSRMTGGSMMRMMQMVGGRAAAEPQLTTIAVKGNQMVTRGKDSMQLVDLAAETTTTVNMKDQTYTVMTFAQTKAMMEKMLAKGGAKDTNVTVDGKETGKTATVNGMNTSEWFMTMIVEGGGGQKGQMRMEVSNWISKSKVSGFEEVTNFQKKMVEKMGLASMAGPMAGPMAQPGMAKGMAEMGKKMAEMGGVPVVTVTRMIPTDPEQIKQMEAMQAQPAPAAGQPSMGDALAGALGGRFGGMGRKKGEPTPSAPPAAAVKGAPVEGSFTGAASMMEMTIETSGYATQGVDPGLFAVPAGFKEVKAKGL